MQQTAHALFGKVAGDAARVGRLHDDGFDPGRQPAAGIRVEPSLPGIGIGDDEIDRGLLIASGGESGQVPGIGNLVPHPPEQGADETAMDLIPDRDESSEGAVFLGAARLALGQGEGLEEALEIVGSDAAAAVDHLEGEQPFPDEDLEDVAGTQSTSSGLW